ncbi:hypothetical protein [Actinobaculum sp. 352]|uniref:hypothetical protein n=1 Tax=Actinobaculum sp. 352 TaxID=2490946 RepID=UPI0013DF66AC|nr:hypothetical protein [Actinobaculum sp. 352]
MEGEFQVMHGPWDDVTFWVAIVTTLGAIVAAVTSRRSARESAAATEKVELQRVKIQGQEVTAKTLSETILRLQEQVRDAEGRVQLIRQNLDAADEKMTRLRDELAEARNDKAGLAVALLDEQAYVAALERHIWAKLPPPPPARPQAGARNREREAAATSGGDVADEDDDEEGDIWRSILGRLWSCIRGKLVWRIDIRRRGLRCIRRSLARLTCIRVGQMVTG